MGAALGAALECSTAPNRRASSPLRPRAIGATTLATPASIMAREGGTYEKVWASDLLGQLVEQGATIKAQLSACANALGLGADPDLDLDLTAGQADDGLPLGDNGVKPTPMSHVPPADSAAISDLLRDRCRELERALATQFARADDAERRLLSAAGAGPTADREEATTPLPASRAAESGTPLTMTPAASLWRFRPQPVEAAAGSAATTPGLSSGGWRAAAELLTGDSGMPSPGSPFLAGGGDARALGFPNLSPLASLPSSSPFLPPGPSPMAWQLGYEGMSARTPLLPSLPAAVHAADSLATPDQAAALAVARRQLVAADLGRADAEAVAADLEARLAAATADAEDTRRRLEEALVLRDSLGEQVWSQAEALRDRLREADERLEELRAAWEQRGQELEAALYRNAELRQQLAEHAELKGDSGGEAAAEEVEALREERSALAARVEVMRADNAALVSRVDAMRERIAFLEAEMEAMRADSDDDARLRSELEGALAESARVLRGQQRLIEELREEVSEATLDRATSDRAALDELRAALARSEERREAEVDVLRAALDAERVEVTRAADREGEEVQGRRAAAEEHDLALRERLAAAEAELAGRNEEVGELLALLREAEAELVARGSEAHDLLAGLEGEREAAEAEARGLRKEVGELAALLAEAGRHNQQLAEDGRRRAASEAEAAALRLSEALEEQRSALAMEAEAAARQALSEQWEEVQARLAEERESAAAEAEALRVARERRMAEMHEEAELAQRDREAALDELRAALERSEERGRALEGALSELRVTVEGLQGERDAVLRESLKSEAARRGVAEGALSLRDGPLTAFEGGRRSERRGYSAAWEQLRSMLREDEEEARARQERRRARAGEGAALTLSVVPPDVLHVGGPEGDDGELLLRRVVQRMAVLRDQNSEMARLLRRLGRESSLLFRMDALHRENSAMKSKYTAMQVRGLCLGLQNVKLCEGSHAVLLL